MKATFLKSIVLLIWFLPLSTFAQKQVKAEQFLWMRYYLKLHVSDAYTIKQEFGDRFSWLPLKQNEYFSRTFVERNFGENWEAGIGFFYAVKPDHYYPEIQSTGNRDEIRPQLELGYSQNILPKLDLNHRYWIEFRIFEQYDNTFEYSNFRFRYKLELRYALTDNIEIKAFDELFINMGNQIVKNIFDQNRYGFSVLSSPFKNFGFELGYLNRFQKQISGTDFKSHHIIRLTLHHTINLAQ